MAHIPVNHPLRPLYRTVAGLIGLYLVVFGIAGVIQTRDTAQFAQHGLPDVLGLHANRAFAILSIVVGLVLLIGAVIGTNLDHWINLFAGLLFLGAGIVMLVLLRTDLNFLGFTVATCVVSFLIGMALLVAGLYGKTGTLEDIIREEVFRHGTGAGRDTSANQSGPDPSHG